MKELPPIGDAAEKAVVAGDRTTLARLLREHEATLRGQRPQSSWSGGLAPNYSGEKIRADSRMAAALRGKPLPD